MESIMPIIYSRLSRRVKAVFIDMIIWLLSIFAAIYLLGFINFEDQFLSIVFIIVFSSSVEPLFVSFTGSSIGHHLFGIRIRQSKKDKNLSILNSYLRFILKLPLGTISLISVMFTKKHQAIHDLLSKSIVVLKNPHDLPEWEHETERVFDKVLFVYPSKLRRTFIVISYILVTYIIYTIAVLNLLSDSCAESHVCTTSEYAIYMFLAAFFTISAFSLTGLGAKGMLYGCRRKLRDA